MGGRVFVRQPTCATHDDMEAVAVGKTAAALYESKPPSVGSRAVGISWRTRRFVDGCTPRSSCSRSRSKDFHGQRVDDGSYTLEGDDFIVINGKRFKYQIDGDELSLEPEPVDISKCTTKECRFDATWVLMVAMPGTTWTRGEIKSQ